MGQPRALTGSIFMGGGIVALHYIAMSAMRLTAMCRYSPWLVALSVLLAIAGSWIALWLAFFFRDEAPGRWKRKIASTLLMGAAIVSMHYFMISVRVAPLGRFIMVITSAFLLVPSVFGLAAGFLARLAFFAGLALLLAVRLFLARGSPGSGVAVSSVSIVFVLIVFSP